MSAADVAVEASGLLTHAFDASSAFDFAVSSSAAAVLAGLFFLELKAGWAGCGCVSGFHVCCLIYLYSIMFWAAIVQPL